MDGWVIVTKTGILYEILKTFCVVFFLIFTKILTNSGNLAQMGLEFCKPEPYHMAHFGEGSGVVDLKYSVGPMKFLAPITGIKFCSFFRACEPMLF